MSKIVAIVWALAVLNGFAAERKESPFGVLDEARAVFNKQEGEAFRGAKAVDYRTLPDADRDLVDMYCDGLITYRPEK